MSDESTLPWGDASPNSIDRHDGLSYDGEDQPETQIGADTPPALKKYNTLTELYKTFVGPPSGGKPPARKRELDNTNEKGWKKRKEIGKDAN